MKNRVEKELRESFKILRPSQRQRQAAKLRHPCPSCQSVMGNKVVDSRYQPHIIGIRRRRECVACRHRWTTYEFHTDALNKLPTAQRLNEIMETAFEVAREIVMQQVNHPTIVNGNGHEAPEGALMLLS